MKEYQKTMHAFLESVCHQYNCMRALPALKEGFKALCEASEGTLMEGTGVDTVSAEPLDYPPPDKNRLFNKECEYANDPVIMRQRNNWITKNGTALDQRADKSDRSLSNLANHMTKLLNEHTGNNDITVICSNSASACYVMYKDSCIGMIFPNHGDDHEWIFDFVNHFSGLRYASAVQSLDSLDESQKAPFINSFNETGTFSPGEVFDIFEASQDVGTDTVLTPSQCVERIIQDATKFENEFIQPYMTGSYCP